MNEPSVPPSSSPPPHPDAVRGARLVRLSRMLLMSGVLGMFASCGTGIAAKAPTLLVVGCGLGFGVIVAAAVVGQVGRGLQGRII